MDITMSSFRKKTLQSTSRKSNGEVRLGHFLPWPNNID